MACTTGAYVEWNTQNCKKGIQNYDNIRVKNDILDVCLATVSPSTVPGCGGSLAAAGVTVLRQL